MRCLVTIDTLHGKQKQCDLLASCSRQQALQNLQCWHPHKAHSAEIVHEQIVWQSYSPVDSLRPKGVRVHALLAA